jgi:hypothetical protein
MPQINPGDVKPCWYMRTLVSAMMDGQLSGFMLKYTEWHVSGCPQCQTSLPFLRALHGRLFELGRTDDVFSLSPERREGLESKLDHVERSIGPYVN